LIKAKRKAKAKLKPQTTINGGTAVNGQATAAKRHSKAHPNEPKPKIPKEVQMSYPEMQGL